MNSTVRFVIRSSNPADFRAITGTLGTEDQSGHDVRIGHVSCNALIPDDDLRGFANALRTAAGLIEDMIPARAGAPPAAPSVMPEGPYAALSDDGEVRP